MLHLLLLPTSMLSHRASIRRCQILVVPLLPALRSPHQIPFHLSPNAIIRSDSPPILRISAPFVLFSPLVAVVLLSVIGEQRGLLQPGSDCSCFMSAIEVEGGAEEPYVRPDAFHANAIVEVHEVRMRIPMFGFAER